MCNVIKIIRYCDFISCVLFEILKALIHKELRVLTRAKKNDKGVLACECLKPYRKIVLVWDLQKQFGNDIIALKIKKVGVGSTDRSY